MIDLGKKPKSLIFIDRLLFLDLDVSKQLKDYLTNGSKVILMADELSFVDNNYLGIEGDLIEDASSLNLNLHHSADRQDIVTLKYWNKGYKSYNYTFFSD